MFQPVGHGTAKSVCSCVLLGHNLGNNQFPGRDRWQDVPRDNNISTCHMPIIYASCIKNCALPLEAHKILLSNPSSLQKMNLVSLSKGDLSENHPMGPWPRSFRDRTKVRLWRAWGAQSTGMGNHPGNWMKKKGTIFKTSLIYFLKSLSNRLVVEPPGP